VTAPTPERAGPLHFTYDGCMALQCFADDPEAEFGETVAFVDPGDSLDFLAGKVREHQAAHGCAQEPNAAPGSDAEAKLTAIRTHCERMAAEFSADMFAVRPQDVRVNAGDILAIIDGAAL
jgi:hypothetical protein